MAAEDPESFDRRLPRLALETLIRWQDGQLMLYSPEGRVEVGINAITDTALFYFDGHTTLGEATRVISGKTTAAPERVAGSLLDLHTFLKGYGFLVDEATSETGGGAQEVP
jgi:hypothetical protein